MSGIKDKVIAITGASRGIGEATAVMLAERGAKVVLMAHSPEQLSAVAGRIADAGGAVAHTTGDVRRREDLARLVALARERFGKLQPGKYDAIDAAARLTSSRRSRASSSSSRGKRASSRRRG